MGIEMLARLLEETAADVPAPALAEAAWGAAQRVRRRRRVVAGAAAATAVAAVGAGTVLAIGAAQPTTSPPVGSTPTVAVSPSAPVVDKLPATLSARDGTPLPRTLKVTGGKDIAKNPVPRAVALYQQDPGQTEKLTPVYVLGSDGTVRWLDDAVKLEFTRDANGDTVTPVLPTSLSPDGRRAAFPQHDSVAIVDLTTGKADTVKLPGWNGYLVWRGNSTVLVGQAHAVYVVDLTHHVSKQLPSAFPLWDMAVDPDTAHPVVELPSGPGQLTVRERVLTTAQPRGEIPVDQNRLGGYRVRGWQGPSWRSGDLIVRAGAGSGPDSTGSGLAAVVDARSGAVVRLLAAAATPLGWLDSNTVLLQANPGIVAWDIRNGQVTSVSTTFDGTVAILPK